MSGGGAFDRWLITWSSATSRGSETVVFPGGLRRGQVIERYESAHAGCYVDNLEYRGEEPVRDEQKNG